MIRPTGLLRLFLILALALSLDGCKTVGKWFGHDKQEATETLGVEALYGEAKQALHSGNYDKAETYYQRLVSRFPYGPYNEQAQLELAYTQYKLEKREDATATIDRFIRVYPTHRHIDYAYYLKAIINFDSENALLSRLARMDTSTRDLGAPTQSFNDFGEVLRRYPNSPYAADSRQRMVYLRNKLARYEWNVGLYYLRRGAYVAAANRGKYLLETYPQSEYEGDALAMMATSYTALGEKQLADDARRVLQSNYPDHPYLSGHWPKGKGWLGPINKLNPFAGEAK